MVQDYSTLKAAIADWLARADLTSRIPTFIQFAEARINRELRVSGQITTATGTASSGVITLPDDYRRALSLSVEFGGQDVEVQPIPSAIHADSGFPVGYVAGDGQFLLVGGTGGEDYALTYFADVAALSDSNTTTWLLTKEPALYLYGALIEASPYLRGRQDDLVIWSQQFRSIMDGLREQDDYARYGNAPAQVVTFNAP